MDGVIEQLLHRREASTNGGGVLGANDRLLHLVVLGAGGSAQQVAQAMRQVLPQGFWLDDKAQYALNFRIIDGDVGLPHNSFRTEPLPQGCLCVYASQLGLEYIRESLEKTLLANLEQEDRLPFHGLPLVVAGRVQALPPQHNSSNKKPQAELARALLSDNPECMFARGLPSTLGQPYKKTKYGPAPASSPLAYQQALLPHGFAARLSGISPQPSTAAQSLVPEVKFFKDGQAWRPPTHLEGNQILQKVRTTLDSSCTIEQNTRRQARSETWKTERRLRLTSSNFGVAAARQHWTLKGLQNITASKDISHIAPIKHGIANEPLAARRYEEVMQAMGHNVTVSNCGLLVNPGFPWLGASPERIAYDPAESSYGVVEIKYPHSLRNK
ncbi:hypothetical protein HPB48_003347 [Haemaphysalis longicornis]|uniref:PG1 pseudoGTPase domain-containing protein n=1 Tax=Haemaphysalis longicornis TaxID=44386 RepID=A0A9J6GCZ4_HAELO|nr:hypothetical protein HPB48_003347 [Haemaphysalis longicornis]